METQKDLKDTDGFDWLESTELAIDKLINGNSCLIDCL